ncbi:molecular chaperone TorD family protein [Vicingaceae bacterium]|nr:molecular chaperone TorD family protein [Vicingaceae bacterium]
MNNLPAAVRSGIEQRAAVYQLLARLWENEVDEEFRTQLCSEPMCGVLIECDARLPVESIDQLAIDYCQLFVGPKDQLLPIQSIWIDGQHESDAAASMRTFIDLVPAWSDRPVTIPDHLGVQLDLQSAFLQSQLKANTIDLPECQAIVRQFQLLHLSWPFSLFDAAEAKADTDFYRGIVRLTRDFLKNEQELFAERPK